MAETFTFTIKPIADLSDVRANVGEIQKAFSKLKLPPKLGVNLNNELNNFMSAYDKFINKQNTGIRNSSDVSSLMKASDSMIASYQKITELMKQVDSSTITNVFKLQGEEVEKIQQKLTTALQNLSKYQDQLNNLNFKGVDKILADVEKLEKKTRSGTVKGLLNTLKIAIDEKDFYQAQNAINELKDAISSPDIKLSPNTVASVQQLINAIEPTTNKFTVLKDKADKAAQAIREINGKPIEAFNKYLEQGNDALRENALDAEKAAKAQANLNKQIGQLESQVESYFGLNAIFRKFADMARQAMETVKELDKAMTETAVVTDFSVSDMWEKLPIYTAEANKLGSTIKDVYEATTLYYQQGLNTTQSMGLAVETLKMARIAGMEAKDATNAMTAALRGFNLELNQTSAQRINDVYSELAAITASDTQEISTAMEKVASLAHNAGMELETTSAFLAQMIETTREAPENLGTALKTVVARFQEMKQDPTKLIDSEGVMLDANKVDKALKSIGVNLLNANGEFRKLDDVFLEIAAKWDTMSMGQQRYIATMAAGSRQQSRFIAMMSNYSRTMELVDSAYNAAGASQKQFEKTLESMDTKLNQLRNAWNQFTMGLMNNEVLKGAVDAGTEFLDVVNKIIDAISGFVPGNKGLNKTLLTLISTFAALSGVRTFLKAGISGGFQWFKGDLSTGGFFKNLLFAGRNNIRDQFKAAGIGDTGTEAGQQVAINFRNGFQYSIRGFSGIFHDVLVKEVDGGLKTGLLQSMDTEVLRKNIINSIKTKTTPSWDPLQANQADLIKFVRDNHMESAVTGINKINIAMGQFGVGTMRAGSALQSFGLILRGTPLAPFGMALQTAGVALSSFGKLLVTVNAEGKVVGAGFSALWKNIGGWTGVGIAAAALAIYGIYKASTASKRALEDLSKTAQNASEHLDTVKQNATEFKSSLEQIKENNDAFKTLVPGTLEFNEKLVESNELILSLIEKFSDLANKLKVDEFGRYFIPEDDLNEYYETLISRRGIAEGVAQLTDLTVAEEKHNRARKKTQQTERFVGQKEKTVKGQKTGEYTKEYKAYLAVQDSVNRRSEQEENEYFTTARVGRTNAFRNAFIGLDLKDAETAARIMADSYYEAYEKEATKNFKDEDLVKLYTTQNGLNFDEIWNDKEQKGQAIKEGRYIALLEIARDKATELDRNLQTLNLTASKTFGTDYGDVSSTFTDLFSGNAENISAQLIRDLSNNPEKIREVVEEIGKESIDALKILKPDMVGAKTEEIVDAIVKELEEQVPRIADTQLGTYSEMIGRFFSTGASSKLMPKTFGKTTTLWEAKTKGDVVGEVLKKLTYAQTQTINDVSAALEKHVGPDATAEFMKGAVSIYTSGVSGRVEELNTVLQGVDWSNSLSRLETYTNMINSKDKDIQKFGHSLLEAAEEANLLSEAVYQVFTSESFSDLYEKQEDYVNILGEFDAAGIERMRDASGELNRLLNTGTITANGFAAALNALDKNGSLDGITSAAIELISQLNSLDAVMTEAHNTVANFNPGIDTGEVEDFAKNNYEKVKEYWENYEFGNEQLINYLKLFAGKDRWTALSKQFKGDLEKIENAIIYGDKDHAGMKLFAEGFEKAWIKGANKEYKGKTKQGNEISLGWKNGNIDLDVGKATTDEVVEWLQEIYGISEEYAELMLTDFENYSADLRRELANNDWNKALPKYIEDKAKLRKDGRIVLTQEELDMIAAARGVDTSQILKEIRTSGQTGGKTNDVRIFDKSKYEDKEGNIDYSKAFQGWLDRVVGTRTEEGRIKRDSGNLLDYLKETGDSVADISGIVVDMQKSGISLSDTQQMIQAGLSGTGKDYLYKGQAITAKDLESLDTFVARMEEINQKTEWENQGYYMGQGFYRAYKEGIKRDSEKLDESKNKTSEATEIKATTDTGTSGGNSTEEVSVTIKKNIDEEINTIENYDENGSNAKRDSSIAKEEELKNIVEYAKEENISTAEAVTNITALKQQQATLEREIARKKSFGLDTTEGETSLSSVGYKLQTIEDKIEEIKRKRKITLEITTEGSIPKGEVQYGHNNYISSTGFYAGSSANGRHGTVGPKNKGGLTLTGEKGFEVAWIPSENRSMILGARGPQMVNLPADTVVYTHDQSKKIVKQKGIPAGSHAERRIHSGSSTSSNGSGTGSGSGSGSTSSDDNKKPHTNWLKVEIDRYNLNQKINKTTEKIEKLTKKIEDSLDKVGTTYDQVNKQVQKQRDYISDNIQYQKELKKSYDQGLKNLDSGKRRLWITTHYQENGEWKTKENNVNVGKYISKNKDGTYTVNKKKIAEDYPLKANQEAVFNAIQSELDKLTSGSNQAAKAIEEYKQQQKDLTQKLAEAFYLWENELTKVYQLTKDLELLSARRGRYEAELALQMARINAGYVSTSKGIQQLVTFQRLELDTIKDKITAQKALIKSQRQELDTFLDFDAQKAQARKTIKSKNSTDAEVEAAKQNLAAYKVADKYITSTKNADGTFDIQLDYKKLEKDRQNGLISKATYDKLKEIYDEAVENNNTLNESFAELAEQIAEPYEKMREYQETLADLEDKLMDALEKAAQKEIDRLTTLNTSLTNATKKIIEQVKKSIDARRRAEDNAKTENDIAKKQQRLATLRANTSGGNQVEIAQLEKEIADSQQQYGRTLEDQMLSDLQNQADEAVKQRQEQIDIAKQQLEWNKVNGVLASQVDNLINNMSSKKTQEEIKELLSQDDGVLTYWKDKIKSEDLQTEISKGIEAQSGIAGIQEYLNSDEFKKIQSWLIRNDKNSVKNPLPTRRAANRANKKIAEARTARDTAKTNLNEAIATGDADKIAEARAAYNEAKANFTAVEGLYGIDTHAKGLLSSLPERKLKTKEEISKLQKGINTLIADNQLTGIKKLGGNGVYGPKTTAAVLALQKKLGLKNTRGNWGPKTAKALKAHKNLKYYKQGGLANSTGPAWLDGTPTKPELVLNAQDTKNFMALRDVLSGVMHDISHIDSSNTYNSPTEININVNVDKISNDYDVDRLVARVKKDIVKDASYRNVTVVRNLR